MASKEPRAILPVACDALMYEKLADLLLVGLGVEGLVARCRGSLP